MNSWSRISGSSIIGQVTTHFRNMIRRTTQDSYEESSEDEENGHQDSFTSRTSQIDIISLLREQLIRQERRITDLTHHVHVLERDKLISDEHQKNSLKNDRIKYLEAALVTTTNELRTAEKRYVDELALVASLRTDLENFHQDVAQSKEETARYRLIATDLKTELTHALATVDSARLESQELKSQLRDAELRHREHCNGKLHQYHDGEVQRVALEQQLSDAHTTITSQSITIEKALENREQLNKEWQARCANLGNMLQEKEQEVKHWQRMYADLEAVVFAINGDRSSINRQLSSQKSKGKGTTTSSNVLHFSQPMNICMKYEVEEAQALSNLLHGELTRAGDAIDLMATFVQQTIAKLAVWDDSPATSTNSVSTELLQAVQAFEQSYRHTMTRSQSTITTMTHSLAPRNTHFSHASGDTSATNTHPQSSSSSVFNRLTVLIAGVCRLVEESIITYQERRALTTELDNTSASLDTAADMCKSVQGKYRDVKQKLKESLTDVEIRRRVHADLQAQFDDLNHQYQSLQQEHQHQQALHEQLQKAYQHLQSEAKLIETVIVHGTNQNQSHQREDNHPHHNGGVMVEVIHNHEDGGWRDRSGGGSPTKVSTGSTQGLKLERGSKSLVGGSPGMDLFEGGIDVFEGDIVESFHSVGVVMNNTNAHPSRGEAVDVSIGANSHDTRASASSNNSTSLNDHGEQERERERERSMQLSTTIASMRNKIASLTDKVEDAVLCVQILAEHGLSLQEQNDELIAQKQLLMHTCTQFEDLRDGLVDLSSACILTQPPKLLASSLNNSGVADAGGGGGGGGGGGSQVTPPIMPSPSRKSGYEYQEAYDPTGLEGFDRTRRVVGYYHRTWGGRGLTVLRARRLSFRGVVIYVLAALRMKRLLVRMQQRAYGPTVVRDRIHWSQCPVDGYSMLPSRDYLRSHASNAAIAHVLMTSCSATKTRQKNAKRVQQTATATATATNPNKNTSSQEEEEKINETNDISFESKANEYDHHNHHNLGSNNGLPFIPTPAVVPTIGTRDHVVLPVSEDRASEDRMSLLELICHRSHHHHRHRHGPHRQGSSREGSVRSMGGYSGRDPPGELYGFPSAARVHSALIHMSRIVKDLRSKEAILQWTEVKYGEQQKDLLLALREAESVLQDRSGGPASAVAANVHSRNATFQHQQQQQQQHKQQQQKQPQPLPQSQQPPPQSPPSTSSSSKPNQSPSPRQRRRVPTVPIPIESSPQSDHHRPGQPIHTTEDRTTTHDHHVSTNTNGLPLDGQNHHHFPPFSPERTNYFTTTDEPTNNDLGMGGFRSSVIDTIDVDVVDTLPSNRPSNYYSADEIIARARMRVGGEVLSSQHETTAAAEKQQIGNFGTTLERTSSPKRRRSSNEDASDPRAVATLYVPPTEFSLNNSSDFRWWTEQSFDTVYSVDSSTIPPGELIHQHHHLRHQISERENTNDQREGIAYTEDVDLEEGGVVADPSSPISWKDPSTRAANGSL